MRDYKKNTELFVRQLGHQRSLLVSKLLNRSKPLKIEVEMNMKKLKSENANSNKKKLSGTWSAWACRQGRRPR